MEVRGDYAICAIAMGLLLLSGTLGQGQDAQKTPSLGEVARRLKAQREKEKQKPVAVYTNDNLPEQESIGVEKSNISKTKESRKQSTKAPSDEGGESKQHGEKYFRSKAEKIRSRLDLHRRQLAVLQQQLGLTKIQYYPNPQKTLEQESTPDFQLEINKLRAKIVQTQKAIADDQKAMEDLREDLRRNGGDPGWIQ